MESYVYFYGAVNIVTKSLESVKIGKANDPKFRLLQLQTSTHCDLVCLKVFEFENENDAYQCESEFHEKYKHLKLRGEWFSISAELLNEVYSTSLPNPKEYESLPAEQEQACKHIHHFCPKCEHVQSFCEGIELNKDFDDIYFYDRYRAWCNTHGIDNPLSKRKLASLSKNEGIRRVRKNNSETNQRWFAWVKEA